MADDCGDDILTYTHLNLIENSLIISFALAYEFRKLTIDPFQNVEVVPTLKYGGSKMGLLSIWDLVLGSKLSLQVKGIILLFLIYVVKIFKARIKNYQTIHFRGEMELIHQRYMRLAIFK